VESARAGPAISAVAISAAANFHNMALSLIVGAAAISPSRRFQTPV